MPIRTSSSRDVFTTRQVANRRSATRTKSWLPRIQLLITSCTSALCESIALTVAEVVEIPHFLYHNGQHTITNIEKWNVRRSESLTPGLTPVVISSAATQHWYALSILPREVTVLPPPPVWYRLLIGVPPTRSAAFSVAQAAYTSVVSEVAVSITVFVSTTSVNSVSVSVVLLTSVTVVVAEGNSVEVSVTVVDSVVSGGAAAVSVTVVVTTSVAQVGFGSHLTQSTPCGYCHALCLMSGPMAFGIFLPACTLALTPPTLTLAPNP
jgi:hypothetical protein